jgi:hypothetical protein
VFLHCNQVVPAAIAVSLLIRYQSISKYVESSRDGLLPGIGGRRFRRAAALELATS